MNVVDVTFEKEVLAAFVTVCESLYLRVEMPAFVSLVVVVEMNSLSA